MNKGNLREPGHTLNVTYITFSAERQNAIQRQMARIEKDYANVVKLKGAKF